jgi:hypothetical protein
LPPRKKGCGPTLESSSTNIFACKLNELAAETVDQAGLGFDSFVADEKQSAVLRGYVRAWLGRSFQQFDTAKLMT